MLFVWLLFGRGQVSLLQPLQLSNSVSLVHHENVVYLSVGIHIIHISLHIYTPAANFQIGLVQMSLQYFMKNEKNAYLKDVKAISKFDFCLQAEC